MNSNQRRKIKKIPGFFSILLAGLLSFSCATLPQPLMEDAARASVQWPGLKLEDLQNGRKLYVGNCGACHALYLPSEYGNDRWDKIMMKMQFKAKIDDKAASTILTYLKTFSKDWVAVTAR